MQPFHLLLFAEMNWPYRTWTRSILFIASDPTSLYCTRLWFVSLVRLVFVFDPGVSALPGRFGLVFREGLFGRFVIRIVLGL